MLIGRVIHRFFLAIICQFALTIGHAETVTNAETVLLMSR